MLRRLCGFARHRRVSEPRGVGLGALGHAAAALHKIAWPVDGEHRDQPRAGEPAEGPAVGIARSTASYDGVRTLREAGPLDGVAELVGPEVRDRVVDGR